MYSELPREPVYACDRGRRLDLVSVWHKSREAMENAPIFSKIGLNFLEK